MRADRRRGAVLHPRSDRGAALVLLVAPRVRAPVGAAGRLLPLGLGRQPAAGPGAERGRFVPVDERDGMVCRGRPVRRSGGSCLGDEALVLRVRDGRPRQLERSHVDVPLPRLARVAADHVLAGGHLDPVEAPARLDGDDAEADVRIARGRVHRVPRRAAQLAGPAQVRAAARRAVGRPLPDVARQVERAAGRRSGRMQAGRRRPADPLPEGGARRVGQLVAPRPEPVVTAAGGRLPLDLGRQPHAVRGAERLGIVARDVRQRHAVVAGDRRAADPEALDRDDPPRRLVLVRRIRDGGIDPHRERPRRNRDPVDQSATTGSTTCEGCSASA